MGSKKAISHLHEGTTVCKHNTYSLNPLQVIVENVIDKDKECPAVIVEKTDKNILRISSYTAIAFINECIVQMTNKWEMMVSFIWISSQTNQIQTILKTLFFCCSLRELLLWTSFTVPKKVTLLLLFVCIG